jgi:hypothetical protein
MMVAAGEPVRVLETLRSPERQAWLYAQGRTDFDTDAHRRRWEALGKPPLDWRPGPKVTWTLTSRHLTGHAIDLGLLVGDDLTWKAPVYREFTRRWGAEALKLGIENLGTKGDWLHWQLTRHALSIRA